MARPPAPWRGALVVACSALAALVALPPASSAAGTPAGYSVTTAGAAVQVVSTQQPAFSIATGDLVDQTVGLVASDFGASTSQARAASYYPGDLVAQAGQLICGQFGPCPFEPPTYPLLAEASWPTVRHAAAGHGVGTSSATASATGNEASTAGTHLSAGLVVGSVTSSTRTAVRDDGLHVRVATVLQDVALGPLAVAGIRVTDDVLVRPDGTHSAKPAVVVTGATVAGTPVELGSAPVPALAERGLTVRVLGSSAAGARSGAVGVRVDVSVPVQGIGVPLPGLPSPDRSYLGSFVLGQVSVVAARDADFELPPLAVPTVPTTPPVLSPAAGQPGGSLPLPGAGAGPVVTAGPPGTAVVTRSFGFENLDLRGLYAVLALGATAGLVVSRALSRRAWRGTWEGAVP